MLCRSISESGADPMIDPASDDLRGDGDPGPSGRPRDEERGEVAG